MLKLGYALVAGVFGAGIVHIAILLLLPGYSTRDAWTRLGEVARPYEFVRLDTELDGSPVVRAGDPLMRALACRFDLADGPVHLKADGVVPFWSASVYDRGGQNIYSLNDSTADDARLDLVVLTPDQMIEVRKDLPEPYRKSAFAETPIGEGIVVLRVFVPDATWSRKVDTYLSGLTCAGPQPPPAN